MIFPKCPKSSIKPARHVLALPHDAGVTIKLKKRCEFSLNTMNYLGHVIHPRQLAVSQHIFDGIQDLKGPDEYFGITLVPGLVKPPRQIVPSFPRIAALLNREFRKDQPTHFGKIAEEELFPLQTLQQKLITLPLLAPPRSTGTYTLHTDPCDTQVGCDSLQQQTEGPYKLAGYRSRCLNDSESAYALRTEKGSQWFGPYYYWDHI